jgi:curved DNA-binding protein CbpA
MAELNKAWATLGDPAKRAQYDASIGMRQSESKVAPVRGDDRPMRAGGAGAETDTGPYGEAGPPPPNPPAHGRPLTFGRYRGWTLNQVLRRDRDYVEWLARTTMGRNYKAELDVILRRVP